MAESDSKLPEVAPSDGGDAILDLEVLSQVCAFAQPDFVARPYLHGLDPYCSRNAMVNLAVTLLPYMAVLELIQSKAMPSRGCQPMR